MNALLALLLVSAQAFGQDKPQVKISARAEKPEVKSGEPFKVTLDLEIPATWHIYPVGKALFGKPTVLAFEGADLAGPVEQPKPKLKKMEGVGEIDYFEGKLTLTAAVRLKGGVKPGPFELKGTLAYQICDPNVCQDNTTSFTIPLKVLEGGSDAAIPDEMSFTILAIRPEKTEVKVGEVFKVAFDIDIPKTWHIYPTGKPIYGIPTEFMFDGAEVAGKIEEPKPIRKKEEIIGDVDYHEGRITMTVPVRLKPGPKPGPLELKGKVTYQICDPRICLDGENPLSLKLTVLEGEVPVQAAVPSELEKRGLLAFLLLAMGGGLVSLVMPCVYPLIPITVTYFVKQGSGSRLRSMALSGAYAIGIIVVFTAVGFIFSLAMGEDGARKFAANPFVNLGVSALFFWFAFSLFGLYEISLPSALTGSLTNKQRSGVGGAFILGGLFSVVTFTCTIPIAATILAVTASAGSRFLGLIAMLVYSATMAVPFYLLGLFPGLLTEVRKGGGDWLHTVKVTAGFAEVALALFYFAKADQVFGWDFLTRPIMISIWVAVLVMMALYLLRVFQLKGDEADPAPPEGESQPPARRQVGIVRMLVAMLFLSNAVYLASGFTGRPLGTWDIVLPVNVGETSTGTGPNPSGEPVLATVAEGEAESRKTGRPLFLEFTGIT